jgi:ribosomal protein S8
MSIIQNILNTINNGQHKYKHFIKYPATNLIVNIATLLFQENLIRSFFFEKSCAKYFVIILLKYSPTIKDFTQLSFIARKVVPFKKCKSILKHKNGMGLYIISTRQGIMTNNVTSKLKLGGISLITIF